MSNRGTTMPLAALLLAAILLTISGCGETTSQATVSNGRIAKLIIAGNAGPAQAEIAAARTVLTRRCMEAQGLRLPAAYATKAAPNRSAILETGEFAAVPPESVALNHAIQTGFEMHASPGLGQAHDRKVALHPPSPLDRHFWAALLGPQGLNGTFVVKGIAKHSYPTEGCIAEADNQLFGSGALAMRAEYLPEDLDLAVGHDVEANPRYLAALRRWSSCMAAVSPPAGGPYALAGELFTHHERGRGRRRGRAYERTVAVRDIRCQYSSGFINTAVALKRRDALRAAAPYQRALATVLATRRHAAAIAKRLVSSMSG